MQAGWIGQCGVRSHYAFQGKRRSLLNAELETHLKKTHFLKKCAGASFKRAYCSFFVLPVEQNLHHGRAERRSSHVQGGAARLAGARRELRARVEQRGGHVQVPAHARPRERGVAARRLAVQGDAERGREQLADQRQVPARARHHLRARIVLEN